MPCSDKHFIPILDELRQREEQTISENQCPSVAKKKRGGPRPGSGPPKGNLNALKHGRYSRRHKIILEAILEVPEAREALIGVMKRNRQRHKQAELEAAYILMRWLSTNNPQFLPAALDQACPEWEAGSGGGHERAAANISASPLSRGDEGGTGAAGDVSPPKEEGSTRSGGGEGARNDQTQIDQLTTSLRRMNESLKRRLLRKTTKKRTQKPRGQPKPRSDG